MDIVDQGVHVNGYIFLKQVSQPNKSVLLRAQTATDGLEWLTSCLLNTWNFLSNILRNVWHVHEHAWNYTKMLENVRKFMCNARQAFQRKKRLIRG